MLTMLDLRASHMLTHAYKYIHVQMKNVLKFVCQSMDSELALGALPVRS